VDEKMKRKYIVIISILTVVAILLSIFTFPYFSSNVLSKRINQSTDVRSTAYILTDTSSGTVPLVVNFKSVLQNFEKNVQYAWDFGDSKYSDEPNPFHTYDKEGTYNCSLAVADDLSESYDFITINVYDNNPPFIKIIVDKTSGNRPMIVHFDVDGFDTDGEIVSYHWEIQYPPFFSYQKLSTHDEKNFSERFLRAGFYEVKLTVTDDAGKVATDYIKIQVLGHKIELLVGKSMYYISTFNSIIQLGKNIINKFNDNTQQSFVERILSRLEANK
jgi:PKD repeat protein